ncbi:hypothetical protein A33M_0124 [Rhodovulum sp. PH10]|nr:hypothetical protein A33M_0124 [Rhodovulum sp. PH10]
MLHLKSPSSRRTALSGRSDGRKTKRYNITIRPLIRSRACPRCNTPTPSWCRARRSSPAARRRFHGYQRGFPRSNDNPLIRLSFRAVTRCSAGAL